MDKKNQSRLIPAGDPYIKINIDASGFEKAYLARHELVKPGSTYDRRFYRKTIWTSSKPIATGIKSIIYYLERLPEKHSVVLITRNRRVTCTFDPTVYTYDTKTELDFTGNQVKISRICICGDDDGPHDIAMDRLILNPKTGRIGVVKDLTGWSLWLTYRRISRDRNFAMLSGNAQSFLVSRKAFHLNPLTISEDQQVEDLVFKIDGVQKKPIYHKDDSLVIKRSKHSVCIVNRNHQNREVAESTRSCQSLPKFLQLLINEFSCKTAPTRDLFLAIIGLVQVENDTNMKVAINKAAAALDVTDVNEQKHLVEMMKDYCSSLHQIESYVELKDGNWHIMCLDKMRDLLMYQIVHDALGFDAIMELMSEGILEITTNIMYECLRNLCECLADLGMGLTLDDKPIKKSRWEFIIDATGQCNINWFEIKPEIRCDGKIVNAIIAEKLALQDHLIEQPDCFHLVDSTTRESAARLLKVIGMTHRATNAQGEIVRVPRLWILDWAALRSSGVTVLLPPQDEKLVDRLTNFDKIEEKPFPTRLQATLRHYQQKGYFWLAFLYEHRLGACLADDMGLGKTLQAISFLGAVNEGIVESHKGAECLPHLIVVPASLVFNWEQEIARFYPDFKVHIYTGSERSDDFETSSVVLTTYGTVRRDIDKLKDHRFHTIVFDEAQAIKNLYADTTCAIRKLQGFFKITMTGTPLENHVGEYYSVVDIAVPGLLGEYNRFKPLIKLGNAADLEVIIRRTKPFVLRRTKEAVLPDLPPKTETDIYLDLTEEQKALYQIEAEQARKVVDDAYRTQITFNARNTSLTAIMKLRQICISPRIIDKSFIGVSPKMDFLIERLRELMIENHSALVFSSYSTVLHIFGETLDRAGIGYVYLDGSTRLPKRKTLVQRFQLGEGPQVFLLTLGAGGKGLNLTQASYVFHLDPWWNPAVENQASDRAHRIGQKKKVMVMRLIMRHTVEEKMMELKKRKMALYKMILEDGIQSNQGTEITREDIYYLLDMSEHNCPAHQPVDKLADLFGI